MKNLLTLLLIAKLALFSGTTGATTYYFSSTDGDDSRTSAQAQNSSTPWKSIDKLNSFFSSLQPGDQVLFKRGDVFYGSINISKSGSSGSPITFGAYGSGNKPMISGFATISSWTSVGNGLYEATVSAGLPTLNMVTVDGAFQVMGKYPKGNSGYLTISSGSTSSISSSGLSGVPNFTGGEIVWRPYHWTLWRATVNSQSSSSVSFTPFPSTSGGPTEAPQSGYGFFFQNHPNACTSLGEWAYNSSSHKITMYGAGSHAVKVSSIENLVSLSGRSYINFDNIALQGANSRSFSIINSNNITINACDIFFSGQDAVNANSGCSNITVTNSNISYSNFNGIVASGSSAWTITGNNISNTATVAGMGGTGEGQYFGIINVKNGSVVALNKVTNTGYIPICFQGTNNTIQNNLVDTFCTVKDDGGGIYCGGQSYAGTKVINNIVLNGIGAATGTPDKDSRVHGIYVDDGGSNVEIAANTVAFSGGAGIYNHNSHELNIHDNTAFDNKTTGIKYYNDGNTIANMTVTGNIFFAKTSSEFVLNSSGGSTNPSKFFATSDNNYWCRPLNENSCFQTLVPSAASYNLAGWKSFTGKESNSSVTPMSISDSKNIRFEYNATSSSKVVNLGATYMDPKGKNYAGSITLAPFTSAVLLYVSGTVSNQAPVANAGQDQNITLPTNTLTLTGTGTDPDGTISSYQWTKISGPTQFTITSPTLAKTSISGLTEGAYQFELKVTDNSGATDKDTVSVTVSAGSNQPPVARAGNSQSITLPTNSVSVDGSNSNDPDGAIASYQWAKILGPSASVILNPNLATTNITSLVQGVYQFELKVTDNSGAVGKDTIQITVGGAPNQSPTANAGLDINITLPTNSVTLSGSGTDDGTIASYQWTKISGPSQYNLVSPGQAQTSVNNLAEGTYRFELKVTDNAGASDRDTVQIIVNPAAIPNQLPTADAGLDINITLPTNSVTLSGSGKDVDGTIASYQWNKISGPSQYSIGDPSKASTSINNLTQGTYQFELKVTDNSGAAATDIVRVTVNAAPNQIPVADAGSDIVITLPTNSVTLSGSGNDADGTIASYQWTKISGPSQYSIGDPSKASTSINNLTQGIYQFELKVTDNSGATATDVVRVTVNAAPNQVPVADAGSDIVITLPNNSVTLSGSGNDADGTIASYQWTKISGPSQYNIISSTKAQTSVNNLAKGTYQFELKVTDNSGATATDIVQVTVNAAPNQVPVADAGSDIVITLPTNDAILSGSGNDPDGTIVSYQWTKISGPTQYTISFPTRTRTTIDNLTEGTYEFELQVTDNSGAAATDIVQVTVNGATPQPNQNPNANAGPDLTITLPVNNVTLNGTGSDPDGNVASYQWTMMSGPAQYDIASATQARTSVNNLAEGVYEFELQVTDNSGATDIDVVQITVNAAAPPPNQSPSADAGADVIITLPTNSTTLSGGGTDPDGTIASYQWNKISGPSQYTLALPNASQTSISDLTQGVYAFELTVTDNSGAIAKDIVQVFVNAAPNQSPTIDAGADLSITLPTNSTTLSGTGTDADGWMASYQWRKIAGPSQYNIASSNSVQTSVNNLTQGVYAFELMATDNSGATAKDTIQVTVNPAPNQSPAADAGNDINITLPTNSITLSGNGVDPDGTIVSYKWTKIAGPAQYNIASSTLAKTGVSGLAQGTYDFELTVTDNSGASSKDTVVVTVNAAVAKPNQVPEANAGSDMQITLPTNNVRLSGRGVDPDGQIASYRWRSVSGPKEFTILSPTRSLTTVTNLAKGVYNFEITVTDNSGATDKDTMQVTVMAAPPNKAPTANAGVDKNLTLPTNSTSLSGSGSDPDGTVSSYQWKKISGPSQYNINSSTRAQATAYNLVQGTYRFELTVTDNAGASAKDTMQVTVNAAAAPINQSPTAKAGSDISITLPTNSTSLSGTGTDPDGTIASYKWTNISGPSQYNIVSSTNAQTTVNNLVKGVYQFEFTVTDNAGKSAKDTIQVTVNAQPVAPNKAPSASAGLDINITLPTNSVILSGNGTDVDGTIASYQWNKISGPSQYNIVSAAQAKTTVNNLIEGIYKFELIVTDNSGATAKDTMQVIVNPAALPANQSPTANAGANLEITLPTDSVDLSGSGNDPDGTIASYKWRRVSGPTQYNIVSSTEAKTVVNGLVEGVYQFELAVTDNSGGSAKDTIQVTVNAAPNQSPTAKAGSDLQISLPTDTATLAGTGTDPDGTIASYKWTMISGPVQPTLASPSKPKTWISKLTEGVYQFELTVTDNSGASAKDTVEVIVLAVPKAFAKVFPNPATSVINIQIEGATTTSSSTALRIYDNKGNLVYQEDFVRPPQPMIKQVNVSRLPGGIYFAELQTGTSKITTLRFMKK